MERLLLAHDLGTSANKATLFREDGTLVASATHPYDSVYRPGGVAEQNPEDWWLAVCDSTRALLAKKPDGAVAAIAFSGMMMGCLCVDRNGVPLGPHMLYCDQRSTKQIRELVEKSGEDAVYRISGNPASAVYSGSKYMWVKECEPDVYRKTHKFLNAKDYLNFRLTGRIATDPTDASGTNLYDLEAWAWSESLIRDAGLDREKFPDIVPSTAVLGELTRQAAEAMGLKAGIPVMAGTADGMAAGIGAGSVAPGNAYNNIGSSAWIGITTDRPLHDPKRRTLTFAHAVPGMFQPMGTMLAAGGVYAWLKREVCRSETARGEETGVSPYAIMDGTAALSPPGANGLIFLPHLMGERTPRWNHLARAGFIGLDMTHTRADLVRAVLEGVALNLGLTVDIFREMGVPIREMTVIGGGVKGELWRRILADVYSADIKRRNYMDEASSIGAAIVAGVGAGIYPDFSAVDRFIPVTDRTEPDPAAVSLYRERKILFNRVYDALEPLLPALAKARGAAE